MGFLESLRVELLPAGVKVLIAAPGFTKSEIRQKALTASGAFQAESPLPEDQLMLAEAVAKAIYRAMHRGQKYLVLTQEGRLVRWLNYLAPGWIKFSTSASRLRPARPCGNRIGKSSGVCGGSAALHWVVSALQVSSRRRVPFLS